MKALGPNNLMPEVCFHLPASSTGPGLRPNRSWKALQIRRCFGPLVDHVSQQSTWPLQPHAAFHLPSLCQWTVQAGHLSNFFPPCLQQAAQLFLAESSRNEKTSVSQSDVPMHGNVTEHFEAQHRDTMCAQSHQNKRTNHRNFSFLPRSCQLYLS